MRDLISKNKEIQQRINSDNKLKSPLLSAFVYFCILGSLAFLFIGEILVVKKGVLGMSYSSRLPVGYKMLDLGIPIVIFAIIFITLANLKHINILIDSPLKKKKFIAILIAIIFLITTFVIANFGLKRLYNAVNCYGMYINASCNNLNFYGK